MDNINASSNKPSLKLQIKKQEPVSTAPGVKKTILKVPSLKIKKKIKKKTKKDVNEIYKKMEHKKHIYEKPDTYVGSCEQEDTITSVFVDKTDEEPAKIIEKEIKVASGWYKCFDELIVNAHDHKKRMDKTIEDLKGKKHHHKPVTTIKVNILEDGSISFYNDGDGIHIEYLEKHKMYPVELIFGTLLSSTNFDDEDNREWGGRNGYGAKLANIFSKSFRVETLDHINKRKLIQTFSDNMNSKTTPKITELTANNLNPYTKIVWLPDYKRFEMGGMSPELFSMIKKRVYDISGVTDKKTKVYFNDKLVETRDFEKYVDLYIGPKTETKRAFEETLGWQVIATSSDDDVFQHTSFVNGIWTSRGGSHVDYITDQIKIKLAEYLKKKKKIDVKPQIVKNQLKVFVNAYKIINPVFDSQTKETLKTHKSKFGVLFEVSDKFIEQLAKTDITKKIQNQAAFKDSQLLSKTDGKKKKKIKVPKLLDANKAGSKSPGESKKCTIIFTEGDSAKTMAVAGLSEVGREYYGVFPLRGKIQNIRGLVSKRILSCDILNTIKTILGLQSGVNYKKQYESTGVWPLRYGKLMLMTDQDHDGSHIKGLVMNIFDVLWPELLEIGFITSMITPIVKAFKKKKEEIFYTLQDYEAWKKITNQKGWRIKYYKGLGTSTTKEAKDYFRKLNIITYKKDPETPNKLDLAFNSSRSFDRKTWLGMYDQSKIPDFKEKHMDFNQFVDEELIHFSNADNVRSIPNFMDGQKPSNRKVLFAAFKRNLRNEIKVAQLSGYTSEHAAYHHGEVSLESTIKNMAQDFVGSNNFNLLEPIGQFGSRLQGGKDAAQSRYIFTKLNPLTRVMFNEDDDVLCNYLDDDGQIIEPEYYYPVLPMLLINGTQGIGTGYSTKVPMYNPMDIINYITNKIDGIDNLPIKPWYRGFKGRIESTSKGSYISRGVYELVNSGSVRITELPINTWTEDYIETLDKLSVEKGKEGPKNFVRDVIDNSTEDSVDILVKMNPLSIKKWHNKFGKDGVIELENRLKLTTSISTSNIIAFDEECKIRKFSSVEELLDRWYGVRFGIYVKRRAHLLAKLKKELDIIKYKVKFILEIVENKRIINNKKKVVIIEELVQSGYPKFGDTEKNYDYLLKMNLYKLSEEEIELLKNKNLQKQSEYDALILKTTEILWKDDISNFKDSWSKSLKAYTKEHTNIKKKILKVTKKRRPKKLVKKK
jgi:DNA topoisomerase II